MLRKLSICLALLSSLVLAPAFLPALAYADTPQNEVCAGIGLTGGTDCNNKTAATNQADSLLKTIVFWFTVIVGVIAIIMVIVGGLRFVLSGGDSGKVTSAKNTIMYALIGLALAALAQVIVHFVLGSV